MGQDAAVRLVGGYLQAYRTLPITRSSRPGRKTSELAYGWFGHCNKVLNAFQVLSYFVCFSFALFQIRHFATISPRPGSSHSTESICATSPYNQLLNWDRSIFLLPFCRSNKPRGQRFEGCIHEVRSTSVSLMFEPNFHTAYFGESYDGNWHSLSQLKLKLQ